MGTGLLTSAGFDPKRLEDIKADLDAAMRVEFGESLELGADTPEGKIDAIMADALTPLWERLEAVYNAFNPSSASGVSLDRLAEITGINRRDATRSTVTLYVRGATATIPANSLVENVDTGVQFRTIAAASIPAGGDIPLATGSSLAITSISRAGTTCTVTTTAPHGLPTGAVVTIAGAVETEYNVTAKITNTGASTFTYEVATTPTSPATGTIVYVDEGLAADHLVLTTVTARAVAHGLITGDFAFVHDADQTAGYNGVFSVTVLDVDHFQYTPPAAPTVTPATGSYNADDAIAVAAQGSSTGPLTSLAGKLTTIVNPVSGWDAVANYNDAVAGLDEESDATFRLRRLAALTGLGNATPDAITGDLLSVEGVITAIVFENPTDATVSGRPPHSIECLVEGGAAADIVQAIWDSKAGGIATYGGTSDTAVDSQGNNQTVNFTRPTDIDIWLELDLTVDAGYPADPAGDNAAEAAILAWADALIIGQDVVVFPYLVASFDAIPGITDVVVRIAGVPDGDPDPSPTLDNNVIIGETERAKFDSARITIVST